VNVEKTTVAEATNIRAASESDPKRFACKLVTSNFMEQPFLVRQQKNHQQNMRLF